MMLQQAARERSDAAIALTLSAPASVSAPARSGPIAGGFAKLGAQSYALAPAALTLVLLAVAAAALQLEGAAFYKKIFPLATLGFVVHALLPREWRLGFFIGLSLLGVGAVFGPRNLALLSIAGVALVAVCHLSIRWSARVALLLTIGFVLAFARMDAPRWLWSPAVWPVFGSMFMLRLISYMHEMKHRRDPVRFSQALAYFFMLPNVAFPLFPVVDSAAFRRTYYVGDEAEIYRRGLHWIARGFIQLVAYRLVYLHALMPPADVSTPLELVRYLVSNFFLYLRVSGQFHVAVGMLHLFGFRLPETHRKYFLAASFTDFWRRINIYWKDFLLKVVYMPVHTAVRRRLQPHLAGNADRAAVVCATILVFFVTWFLHAAQWFWIVGTWLFTAPDVLFWAILGVLLTFNALRELQHPERPQTWRSIKELPAFALRVAGTFLVISILWMLWSSGSLWEFKWTIDAFFGPKSNLPVLLPTIAVVGVAAWALLPRPTASRRIDPSPERTAGRGTLAATALAAGALVLVGMPAIDRFVPASAARVLASTRSGELSRADAEFLRRGYYEALTTGPGIRRVQLWGAEAEANANEFRWDAKLVLRDRDDFLLSELRPSTVAPAGGALATTNSAGLRDREYSRDHAPGSYRLAVLGASYVWGSGVKDDETFENRLEARLNAEHPDARITKYDVLNFAVPAYTPAQQLYQLEHKVLEFKPDAILFVTHPAHGNEVLSNLARVVSTGVEIPPEYAYLSEVAWKAGLRLGIPVQRGERLIKPRQNDLVAWIFKRVVDDCRAAGVRPIWLLLGTPGYVAVESENEMLVQLAKEAGFEVVDFSHLYDGFDVRTLQISRWDIHPNRSGHQVIADSLFGLWRSTIGPRPATRAAGAGVRRNAAPARPDR